MIRELDALREAAPEGWRLDLVYKKIRHIYFRVDPRCKTVRISLPRGIGRPGLKAAVAAKTGWLLRQMNAPEQRFRASPEFLTTDTTWLRGRAFALAAAENPGPAGVVLREDPAGIVVRTRPGTTGEKQREVLDRWYREQLRADVRGLLEVWEPRMGVRAADFGIRKMKTRWGSCNVRARRIWVNLALIRLDPTFLEYVVVHELAHLLESGHNRRFYGFMDCFLPGWKSLKAKLNQYRL